jgi:hypothetical protein
MHDSETTRAGALTAIAHQQSAAPAFGDLGAWVVYNFHNMAATAVCDAGEYVMKREHKRSLRVRKPNRRPAVRVLALLGVAGYLAGKAARS